MLLFKCMLRKYAPPFLVMNHFVSTAFRKNTFRQVWAAQTPGLCGLTSGLQADVAQSVWVRHGERSGASRPAAMRHSSRRVECLQSKGPSSSNPNRAEHSPPHTQHQREPLTLRVTQHEALNCHTHWPGLPQKMLCSDWIRNVMQRPPLCFNSGAVFMFDYFCLLLVFLLSWGL